MEKLTVEKVYARSMRLVIPPCTEKNFHLKSTTWKIGSHGKAADDRSASSVNNCVFSCEKLERNAA
jgi:hypothetical protein